MTRPSSSLNRRLQHTLGIDAPILQSGMGGVAGPELVAAVSNAGGLGILAALRLPPDNVRAAIRKVRDLTDKPFGVNIWLHDDVRIPPRIEHVSDDTIRSVQTVFNELRPRYDLQPTLERPDQGPALVEAALDVMIEERIPVFSAAIGIPEAALINRFHEVGTPVISMVATLEDAAAAQANGVDVVIAQGTEAGGHRSYGQKLSLPEAVGTSTMTLVPEIVDTFGPDLPIVAAGGIVDGRGLAAMLALGADGVLLGTRFVATKESQATELWKRRLTSGPRSTTLTDGFTGQWARTLTSDFSDHWAQANVEPLPGLLQSVAGADLFAAARNADDDQMYPLYAGAGVATMSGIPGASDVVAELVADATAILGRHR